MKHIPFNRPRLAGREIEYINEALEAGQLAGDGLFTERCQALLSSQLAGRHVLLTHSCTAALEMSAMLCGIEPGDEVIMPSYTFVSTANAVVLRGGTPIFVDIRQDTLNLDEQLIEAAVTERTKAIWPVHYAGVPAEMSEIGRIAEKHGLFVVEDAAQALGSSYEGRPAGALGDLAAISFHETKNVICGEGGALVIGRPELLERAEIIREKGTNRKRFFRGAVDKYTWVEPGSSFLPGELIAAFLLAQLEKAPIINDERKALWSKYSAALQTFVERGVQLTRLPGNVTHNGHLFYLIMPHAEQRQELISRMREERVLTPFHYVSLHDSPGGKRYGKTSGALPVTEMVSERLLRLPLYRGMDSDCDHVIERLQLHLDEIL